jgi:spore maturation protein CgeB
VRKRTLARIRRRHPRIRIVGFSGDDMMQRYNQSRQWRQHLPLYDVFFSTKTYNVPELMALGCRRVEFVDNSYDPATHRPLELTAAERARFACDVGFVGQWEAARFRSIRALIDAGFPVRVWGPDWDQFRAKIPGLDVADAWLSGLEYARAVNATRINLGFLRKSNRDLQTTRSVEIPACQAFMLAERTDEHAKLFQEGVEAEFFGSDEELITKVRYYLAHEAERVAIAERGLERCRRSGYSNHDHLRAMIAIVQSLDTRPATALHGG